MFTVVAGKIAQVSTDILTLPYYRFYRQNTLLPIQAIAKSIEDRAPDKDVSDQLKRWRERKLNEFQLVMIAVRIALFPLFEITTDLYT